MRIQILGTAAAEAWPAVFCNCDTCNRARAAGGKNYRSRTSIQIDDICKIDLPPDTYHHMVRESLDLSALAHLFVTHSHTDHFCAGELEWYGPPFAFNLKNPPLRVYGNSAVVAKARSAISAQAAPPVEVFEIQPFVPVNAGSLTFTPLLASHMPEEQCLNYLIASDTASVLYTPDSGEYQQETLDYLCNQKLDMAIVECTLGNQNYPPTGHMTFQAVLALRDTLAKHNAVTSETPVIITHFSHNIGMLHEEFEAIANPEGITVAYDGMVVEV